MDVQDISEQHKAVIKNWTMIKIVAVDEYKPSGVNGQIQELANVYHARVDLWCAHCVISMCKWYYQNYKDKV